MNEMEAIVLENQRILDELKKKWEEDFKVSKEIWAKSPGWPAKLVRTCFVLHGVKYTLRPEDLGLEDLVFGEGFMELMQNDIGEDLKAYGATDVMHFGFID